MVSSAQQAVFDNILNSVQALGPPVGPSGPEALRKLRAFDGYGEDQNPSAVRAYDPSLLSIPSHGNNAVPLEDLLGPDGGMVVSEFCRSKLLRADEARRRLGACGVAHAYSDPQLREPKKYHAFTQRLLDCGLVELTETRPTEFVECFFVAKKDGRLRMVVDCRRANQWFESSEHVALCTAESLSRIELEPGAKLFVSSADLKDAFYHFELPAQLRTFFGMRSVSSDFLKLPDGHFAEGRHCRLYPQLHVLPMGWTHALWWCQTIHQKIVQDAGASRDLCLEDKAACPTGGPLHIEYVDNYVVLGSSKAAVQDLAQAGATALRSKGLVVHEEESSEGDIKVLGWQFSGTDFRPLPHRVWRIRHAIDHILKTGRITGVQLEKVLGHACFVNLGRREAMSVFGECYTFIQRHYNKLYRLWKSVRRELYIYKGILPLIWRDLAQPWSTTVSAIDASVWGLGVTTSEFNPSEVQHSGRY